MAELEAEYTFLCYSDSTKTNRNSSTVWILLAFFQSSTVSEAKATKCNGSEKANKPKKYPQMARLSSSQWHFYDITSYILQSVFSTSCKYVQFLRY